MSPCRWVVEGGIRFHVPGCWGTVHDPDGPCHCPTNKRSLEDRIEALERRLKASLSTPDALKGEN